MHSFCLFLSTTRLAALHIIIMWGRIFSWEREEFTDVILVCLCFTRKIVILSACTRNLVLGQVADGGYSIPLGPFHSTPLWSRFIAGSILMVEKRIEVWNRSKIFLITSIQLNIPSHPSHCRIGCASHSILKIPQPLLSRAVQLNCLGLSGPDPSYGRSG